MPSFHHAYTAPINPAGAEPVLTRDQAWSGLQLQVRRPAEFVPAIKSSEVVSDEGDVVTRVVEFHSGPGGAVPPGGLPGGGVPMREVCTSHRPARVVYEMETGDRVTSVLGVGAGGDEDLYLTYIFDMDGAKVGEAQSVKIAKLAVEGSIATLRRLAKEGQI